MFSADYKFYVLIGDETSIGTALAIREEAEKYNHKFHSFFALDNHSILNTLHLDGSSFHKNEALQIVEQIMCDIFDGVIRINESAFYLSGNGRILQYVRKELKRMGVQSHQIFAQAYWLEGRKGL